MAGLAWERTHVVLSRYLIEFKVIYDSQMIRVCCQSISETLNESRKRTRTFSGLFVRISTLTYCIPYIFHVHDKIVVCFSNISAYFARNAESLITQESSRKSCSLAGGFVPTRSHRGGRARRYLVAIEF